MVIMHMSNYEDVYMVEFIKFFPNGLVTILRSAIHHHDELLSTLRYRKDECITMKCLQQFSCCCYS